VVALAAFLTWAMWQAYMETPWTRDGTVRAYVVTMAPEVAGRIVELPLADNQFVHKGDLLMVIDPTNYEIAVRQARAALEQAKATAKHAQTESQRRQKPSELSITLEQKQAFASSALSADAAYQQTLANRDQARVNLARTRIVSPVNGYVTNLLAQLGDFVNIGEKSISVVDADSFWGRWLFRGIKSRANARRRSGNNQIDGVPPSRSRPRRQHCPRHQRRERTTGLLGPRVGEPDLHMGPSGTARAGTHTYR
jgi:multidrug resistance efflux pump